MRPLPPLATLAALAALVLAVAAPPAADAQGAAPTPPAPGARGTPRIGVLAGWNSATISDAEGLDTERRNGFGGGLYVTFPLGGSLSVQPELLFAQRGTKANIDLGTVDPDFPAGNIETTVKLNYVEIPVLLRFDVPTTSGIRPHLYVGPTFAFNVSCSIHASAFGESASMDCDNEDIQVEPKTFDAGAMLGGGLAFDVAGGRQLTIGARYTFGLTNVFENTAEGTDPKHRVLAIYGAFDVPFRRR